MPFVQTIYLATHAAAYEGMEADAESAGSMNLSRTVEAVVGFGKAVSQGAGDHGVVPFATAPTKFLGVTVRDQAIDANTSDAFRVADTAAVKIEGGIYVAVAAPVVAGDPVYLTAAGAFTNVSAGNTLVPRATFRTTAASGGLSLLRLQ